MKKERKHSIDRLFLESLGGNKIDPSPRIWESLAAYIPIRGVQGMFLYLFSGILIGVFSFFMHSSLQTGNEIIAEVPAVKPIEESASLQTGETLNENIPENTFSDEPATTAVSADQYDPPAEPVIISSSQGSISTSVGETYIEQTKPSNSNSSSTGYTPGQTESYLAVSLPLPYMESTKVQVEANSTMGIREAGDAEVLDPIFNLKDSYARPANLLFGASFSPAVNIYPEGQNRNDYSLEFVAAYEKSRFIVETGIGGNYTTESARYQVNYTTYDSVGYFFNVNSFSFDPANPDSVIFETSLKNLYDSIDHYTIRENTNKYAYLQIPLRVGYRIVQTPKFSLDLKAGLLFSLQVYKEVPDVPYQGSDAYNIEVIRQYPDRLTTSWQYTIGAGFNYHMNNKVRLTLAPYYRQYIKSAYSPTSVYPASSPHAFGIRGGIYFHF